MGEFIDQFELEYTKARRILIQEKEINLELKAISAKFEKRKECIKKEFEKNDKQLEDEYYIEEQKLIDELRHINKEKIELKKTISDEFKTDLKFIMNPELIDISCSLYNRGYTFDNGFIVGERVTFKSDDFNEIKQFLWNQNEILIYPSFPIGIIVNENPPESMIVMFVSMEKKKYFIEIPTKDIKRCDDKSMAIDTVK